MTRDFIKIRGARVNNLKNVSLDIPRDKFVVVTGLSGSGKSSLAFDTIFAEGNRRYLENLSSYARQFLELNAKPDADKIENLSPAIAIDQKSVGRSPRSTVGTMTEVYDYLRVLFSKVGVPHCPKCGQVLTRRSRDEILEEIFDLPNTSMIAVLAPFGQKNETAPQVLRSVSQLGYARVRFLGKIRALSEALAIASDKIDSSVEIVIDRVALDKKNLDRERILDSIETSIRLGRGEVIILVGEKEEKKYNRDFTCRQCFVTIGNITPASFSFNNPEGACPHCRGLGIKQEIDPALVIPNKNLSISEGAIAPWSKSGGRVNGNSFQLAKIEELGKVIGFSVHEPVKNIAEKKIGAILYGFPEELLVKKATVDGVKNFKTFYKGVIPELEEKYNQTGSNYVMGEIERFMIPRLCPVCLGKRLKDEYLNVFICDKSIDDLAGLSVSKLKEFFKYLKRKEFSPEDERVVRALSLEIASRLEALENVGLDYLTLSRGTDSIAGGEAQRVRLAVQLGSQLMGIVYVFDEPTVGLHNRDSEKLILALKKLKEAGNSLIVVEHDQEMIKAADWIVDLGPGAGEDGGNLEFSGTLKNLLKSNTSTAKYMSGREKVVSKTGYRKGSGKSLEIVGAREHNLKDIDVEIPLGKFVAISGVSGSGKSSLISDILSKALVKYFYKARTQPGEHKKIKGLSEINKVISIDQNPIGRTPRSNAATYTGVFSHIRDLFANTEEARNRFYDASRFSFNMRGGRCEVCQGEGVQRIEMQFMPDMYVKCPVCGGARYNQKTLEIEYQGVNIAEVLDMSAAYALKFFRKSPLIVEKLETLNAVGLGYLKLGQSATTLSGGEAQRIKLATELARKQTGRTLYILDEPTTGLHFEDVKRLIGVLDSLVEKGNTVLVVEHNADVIKSADWVIDLGPEGGDKGGYLVFSGPPDKLAKCKKSWTGKYL